MVQKAGLTFQQVEEVAQFPGRLVKYGSVLVHGAREQPVKLSPSQRGECLHHCVRRRVSDMSMGNVGLRQDGINLAGFLVSQPVIDGDFQRCSIRS